MSFKVYSGNTNLDQVETTYTTLTKLEPATRYLLSVTEIDGTDESDKSNIVEITTLGKLTLPTTKLVDSVKFSTDPLGIELTGFGMDTRFGGTVPVNVPILSNTIVSGQRVLEVAATAGNYPDSPVAIVKTPKDLTLSIIDDITIRLNWKRGE